MDLSGLVDGYYSYNANRPSTTTAFGQTNQLYNFNDQTDQFNLSELRLTLNHDPDPIGAHVDLVYGRVDDLINGTDTSAGTGKYIEQAYMSLKPPKAKGLELDFGKFVTSAGAEVIEAMSNWNYSRSELFVYTLPYWHFGLRTSMPLGKYETVGVQVVNGWNNITANNGGATVGLTSALATPKASWYLNYYVGPRNYNTQKGYDNLIDTTLLLTPTSKFNAYINYDYHQARADAPPTNPLITHIQGIAFAARQQITANSALAGRYEYMNDMLGTSIGTPGQDDTQEFTATYEYKMPAGIVSRIEYRRDWSKVPYFDKGNTNAAVDAQSTVTAGFIAFFGPKR